MSPTDADFTELNALRAALRAATLEPEAQVLARARTSLHWSADARQRARAVAASLVSGARARAAERPLVDSFLQEFGLSNPEGIALMCLAEALLRIPDGQTADRLIAETIARGDWSAHHGHSASLFVNASTFALILTGQLIELPEDSREHPGPWVQRLARRLGEPIVRTALRRAMRILGSEFVVGRTLAEALARARSDPELALCSYDMLGEGARTLLDAEHYRASYAAALEAIAAEGAGPTVHARSGLSIKLSALEPRFELLQRRRVLERLLPKVQDLARRAARAGIALTLDAEEADRLDLSLDLFAALAADAQTRHWEGLGLVVQAYGRRALPLIDWIAALARHQQRRVCVRLVKGAYWDSEIKRAQELGLSSYPVLTRKAATDVSYLACATRLFAQRRWLYPQFATHNAYAIGAVLQLRPDGAACEFQRLHGMGAVLYAEARRQIESFPPVRTYAPVGRHEDLLAYLVRRLLENGANTSFVNRFLDADVPVETVVADPLEQLARPGQRLPEPGEILGHDRVNSRGVDFGNPADLAVLLAGLDADPTPATAAPILDGEALGGTARPIHNPADRRERIGQCVDASRTHIQAAFDAASRAQHDWDGMGGPARAAFLGRAAQAVAAARPALIRLLVREAGKTLPDAVSEVREAEDLCRYYAVQAEQRFGEPLALPGPTGEDNTLHLHGRGVFACISPWNFPLAICLGQISAALAAGNTVVAKAAETTPLIGAAAVRLLHAAGIPAAALQFMPASGEVFGQVALAHPRLSGVALTGSLATAQAIHRALAARSGAIVPLIAETGGLNAMLVDSSALLEQVADDVVRSAFSSAGQRCSALRLLCVQEEVADRLLALLVGAMQELIIGDPADPATDVGPLISAAATTRLARHAARLRQEAHCVYACALPPHLLHGSFFAPVLFELDHMAQLQREEFGPILHLLRYPARALPEVLAGLRTTGYGLTLGIHSRLRQFWHDIVGATAIGNTYVNRSMIGAVPGVQPFGGEGLSGTGPKAGGPHYLLRFATERTLSINTVATGGNAELLNRPA